MKAAPFLKTVGTRIPDKNAGVGLLKLAKHIDDLDDVVRGLKSAASSSKDEETARIIKRHLVAIQKVIDNK